MKVQTTWVGGLLDIFQQTLLMEGMKDLKHQIEKLSWRFQDHLNDFSKNLKISRTPLKIWRTPF